MAKKYTVSFQIEAAESDIIKLEAQVRDLVRTVLAPALEVEMYPYSLTIKKARN